MASNLDELLHGLPADVRDYAREAAALLEAERTDKQVGGPEHAISLPLLLFLMERYRPRASAQRLVSELTALVTVMDGRRPDSDGIWSFAPEDLVAFLLEASGQFVRHYPGLLLRRR